MVDSRAKGREEESEGKPDGRFDEVSPATRRGRSRHRQRYWPTGMCTSCIVVAEHRLPSPCVRNIGQYPVLRRCVTRREGEPAGARRHRFIVSLPTPPWHPNRPTSIPSPDPRTTTHPTARATRSQPAKLRDRRAERRCSPSDRLLSDGPPAHPPYDPADVLAAAYQLVAYHLHLIREPAKALPCLHLT